MAILVTNAPLLFDTITPNDSDLLTATGTVTGTGCSTGSSQRQPVTLTVSAVVGMITDKYLLSIVMIIGIIGNILNIVVLTRREMRSATVQILIAMSISDLIVLILQVPHLLMLLVFNEHKYQVWYYHYFVFCRYPLSNILLGFTLWLSVMVTLERCLAFNKSHKNGNACGLLRFFCSQKDNATRLIVCVFACSFAFNALRLFEYQVNPQFIHATPSSGCNSSGGYPRPYVHRQFMVGMLASAYFWLSAAMHNLVPMITLISLTYVLARRIRRHDQLKARLANSKPAEEKARAECRSCPADLRESIGGAQSSPLYNCETNQIKLNSAVTDAAYAAVAGGGQQKRNSRSALRRAGSRNHASLSRTITILVICIVILFILTDSIAVYLVISIAIFSRDVIYSNEVNNCLRHISNLLVVTNSSCNFILFCSTSKLYRTLFIRTLNACFCKRHADRAGPVVTVSDRQSEASVYPAAEKQPATNTANV